ncbi:MAG TPA: IclR family transcriptional regulator [Stellaceae bacterium]|nr:IclR family transcriptional regulator [Stellaceae bacterium]
MAKVSTVKRIAASEKPPPEAARGGGIQSLERAFGILEEVARNREGINLSELSKRVGLHNSTTFHLVKTMVTLGYIEQAKDSKRYRVGRRLFTLAAAALDEIELVNLATPVLESLTRATGECSHFAIRSGDDIVVLAKTAGAGMFQMVDRAGVVRPAHCTALGKVLLAALTPAQIESYLAGHELRRFTPKTIVEREALVRELKDVRRTGIGFDDGEFDAEARCVAVPVRDFTGQVAGAIGLSGPIWRLSIQSLQEKAQQVREAAADLSRELGYDTASAIAKIPAAKS